MAQYTGVYENGTKPIEIHNKFLLLFSKKETYFYTSYRGRRGRDRMVVVFKHFCSISAYHH